MARAGPTPRIPLSLNHMKLPFETPFEGNDAICTARLTIDNDIEGLQAKIRELRKKRNDLSSISVIPPELLAKIFIFFRDICNDTSYYLRSPWTVWIRVGHVCHHWREVALSCPTLWSTPIFTNPDLVQEMMRRSKKAALTIRATIINWTPRLLDQLETTVAQLSRIQNLQIALGGHHDRLKNLLSTLHGPAPLLEALSLSNPTYPTLGGRITMPDDAFKEAPCLRSIELEYFNIRWESPIFKHRNLTVLRLRHVNRSESFTTSTSQMVDALSNMVHLRILELVDSLPQYTTGGDYDKSLQFRFLEQMTIDSKAPECAGLIRHVQYPPQTKIKLRCTVAREEIDECSTILSVVGRNLHHASSDEPGSDHPFPSVTLRAAELKFSPTGGAEILVHDKKRLAWRTHVPVYGRLDPVANIFLEGDTINRSQERIFRDVCTFFDLSQLTGLILNWRCDNSLVLRECLGKLKKLESVQVTECFNRLCQALEESFDSHTVAPGDEPQARARYALRKRKSTFSFPPVTAFPSLKTLAIKYGEFSWRLAPGNLELLIDMLMQRCDSDAPIECLILDNCAGLRDSHLKRLAEIVTDVYVDGDRVDVTDLNMVGEYSDDDDDNEFYSDEADDDFYDYDPFFSFDYDLDEYGWPMGF